MTQVAESRTANGRGWQRFRLPDSIFVKCVLALALTMVVVVALVTYQAIQSKQEVAREMTLEFGAQITLLVGEDSAAAIRFRKAEDLEALLQATLERLEDRATSGLVMAADGTILAQVVSAGDRPDLMLDLARSAISTGEQAANLDRLVFAQPVSYGRDGDTIGAVVLDWSTEAAFRKVEAEKWKTIWLASGVSVLLILAVGLILKGVVSRPLLAVAAAMKQVSDGNFDAEIPDLRRGNEIGIVVRTLEAFRDQLRDGEATRRDAAVKSAAVDAASAPIMIADPDGTITYANPAIGDLFRSHLTAIRSRVPAMDPDALVGSSIDLFHVALQKNREMLANMGDRPHDTDLEFGDVTIALSISSIDRDGVRVGYATEWTDVTQSRLNEAVLSSLDANQARAEFDTDGRLVDMNAAFAALSGLEPGRAEHRFGSIVSGVGGQPVDPSESRFGDFRIAGMDGRVAVIHGGLSAVTNRSGKTVRSVLIGVDVTEERARAEAADRDRERMLAQQAQMISALRDALSALSDGDLTGRISTEFAPDYEELRTDFIAATEKLEAALAAVVDNAGTIHGEAAQITTAADDLSRRTEQQAATLEETAAAVAELTASVQSSAAGAREAAQVVSDARDNAHTSGGVVRDAVTAMSEIEASSDKISKIISLIDDIAFQTNLLALNAGVEAARAGDAGRGFAVVASEVRVLAQRSSDAAREINDLISTSGQHVKRGVKLVGEAGTALEKIVASVGSIAEHVSAIAASAQEQSTGLEEINNAMGQLDQVTQKNAAMFEETTAASHALNRGAATLKAVVETFRTRAGTAPPAVAAPAPAFRSERGDPAPAPVPQKAPRTQGPLALAAEDDDWQDF